MRLAIICEGRTETAFKSVLHDFLKPRLAGNMPKLDLFPCSGRVYTHEKLRRTVEKLLSDRKQPADAVIALTDVYTGTNPPEFADAADAKQKLRQWVGDEPRFYPHVALHDFEAWLLPYWDEIQKLAGSNRARPGRNPEQVDHGNPPAHRIQEVFRTGTKGRAYVKPRDANRILRGKDLLVAGGGLFRTEGVPEHNSQAL
jgi:hypothetical protein